MGLLQFFRSSCLKSSYSLLLSFFFSAFYFSHRIGSSFVRLSHPFFHVLLALGSKCFSVKSQSSVNQRISTTLKRFHEIYYFNIPRICQDDLTFDSFYSAIQSTRRCETPRIKPCIILNLLPSILQDDSKYEYILDFIDIVEVAKVFHREQFVKFPRTLSLLLWNAFVPEAGVKRFDGPEIIVVRCSRKRIKTCDQETSTSGRIQHLLEKALNKIGYSKDECKWSNREIGFKSFFFHWCWRSAQDWKGVADSI